MPVLSDRVGALQESAIRKLDLTVAQQKNVHFYRLNIGQPDVPTPQPILDAIAAFQPNVIAYGPASGLPGCRKAAADYHRRWGPTLRPQDVAVTVGGSEALLFAMTAICDPGDEILVPEPYYTNYNGFATVAGARVRPIQTTIEDNFALPSDDVLDRMVSDRTRAIVFSNPGNPTGAVYSHSEIQRLLRWAIRRDLFVIADEVYRRIWFEAPPTSALEFPEAAENVIVIDSLSKTYSSCGLRLGFLISKNATLMEKVERLGQARLGAQPLAQQAGIAALSMGEDYYAGIRQTYKRRVDAMMDAIADIPGVSAPRPEGAFYAMLELPIDDAEAFARFLVTDFRSDGESAVVAPGPGFYADRERGRRQIRLAAVLNEDAIRRALAIIGEGLQAYRSRH